MTQSLSKPFDRRKMIHLAAGYLLGGLFAFAPRNPDAKFEAVFINYFPDLSEPEVSAWYNRIYNTAAIARVTERYTKQGLILSRTYTSNRQQDECRMIFASEDAFLRWDRELFEKGSYDHQEFLNSGFKMWSNIPRRLEKNDFYKDRLILFKV